MQVIVSEEITDENMNRIELEIAAKIVIFERKLLRFTSQINKTWS